MYTHSHYIIITSSSTHRGIFPHAISFLRRAPILGIVLNLPGISRVSKYIINTRNILCVNINFILAGC